jgi:hypothetical protein
VENFHQTPVVTEEAYHYSDKEPEVVGLTLDDTRAPVR